ncbi:MAG: S8/S53 family peptidase [Planctomycetes bacterium]|nr:S8/S53 family peptidase [Planctomycetota bacterium]
MLASRLLLVSMTLACHAIAAVPQGADGLDASVAPVSCLIAGTDRIAAERRGRLEAVRDAVLARDETAFAAALGALEGLHAAELDRLAVELRALGGTEVRRSTVFGVCIASVPPAAVETLRARFASADLALETSHAPCLRTATNANNHAVDLVQATTSGYRGHGAGLALLDTGIDARCAATGRPHPAFDLGPGRDGTRVRAALSGTPDPNDREDQSGHGTAISGIALGRDWIPGPDGDDGFAPEAHVVSLKITRGTSTSYRDGDLVLAIDEVARRRLSDALGVANFSWEGQPNPIHVTQRTLDELAHFFDVLVIGASGNAGQLPNPAALSAGFTNGLSVGAVLADSHVVWPSSTNGPLALDPLRTWPDLCTVGVGLRTPWRDSPGGESPVQNGTSFAAPIVAGTALILRGAVPTLDALETKALLLGSTLDIASANPASNRYDFGLGFLRADFAVDALRTGLRVRGRARTASPDFVVPLEDGSPGESRVATLVWNRVDAASNAIDDLDLLVVDGSGRVVAAAESPRNLYERVVFTVAGAGPYELRVRNRNLLHDALPFALVCHANRGGLRQDGAWESFGAACDGHGLDPSQGFQFPTSAAGRFANNHTPLPLASTPCRVLQILDGSAVQNGVRIDGVALRRDDASVTAPSFEVDLEIRMGHTLRAPLAVVPEFDRNYDGEPTIVLPRTRVRFPGVMGQVPQANVFDHVIAFAQPFVASTTGGQNLVIEFRVHGHDLGSQPFGLDFDAELGFGTALVAGLGNPAAPTGQPDPIGIAMSLLSNSIGVVAPKLTADRAPRLGETMLVALRNAPPCSMAALVHGADATTWGTYALPVEFDPLGAPGCRLLVRPDALLSVGIDANGQGVVPVSIPNLPSVTGEIFYQQFLVLDPAANGLGLTVSDGARARVGG